MGYMASMWLGFGGALAAVAWTGEPVTSTDQGVARYVEKFSPNMITAVLVGVAGLTLLLNAGGGLYWLIPATMARVSWAA